MKHEDLQAKARKLGIKSNQKTAALKEAIVAAQPTAAGPQHRAHGCLGAYVGGEWVDIEDCASRFSITDGSGVGSCAGRCPRSRSRTSAAREDGAYDVLVIGAGAIGAAVARELSKTMAHVLLIDAADDVTQGATKGNSGIVHAGYDDHPGSLHAKYCWAGNQMFSQLDEELHFGFQRNGSLVVAKTDADMALLDTLMERGRVNGVENLEIIDQAELRRLEPHISPDAIGALRSPDAGTITPYEYTIALAENAVDNGVELRLRREVVDIEVVDAAADGGGGFVVTAKHWEPSAYAASVARAAAFRTLRRLGSAIVAACAVAWAAGLAPHVVAALGAAAFALVALRSPWGSAAAAYAYSPSAGTVLRGVAERERIRCDFIVNAAGCGSDAIARMVGDDSFTILPRYGEYILLHKDEGHKVHHTLFPCPDPHLGKGVLVQGTLWGNLILGPTSRDSMEWNEATQAWEVNPATRDAPSRDILKYILSHCKRLVPSFDARRVIHTFSGARAKNTTGEWVIGPVLPTATSPGVPHFVNAAAIDSPGIAASPAIAADVARMLVAQGCGAAARADPSFNPRRAPIIVPKRKGLRGLKMSKASEPFKHGATPAANVVCKCERVTEAEVVDAIHRSLPIDSTQAIRKRTRAGMGHCQGDDANYGCEHRVAAIIARETGLPLELVARRPWPASSLLSSRFAYKSEAVQNDLEKLSATTPS